MVGSTQSVKINCRRCGQQVESDKFILDPVYKMMVCPKCVQERKTSAFKRTAAPKVEEPKPVEKPKPAGWDEEDDELEYLSKQKGASEKPVIEKLADGKMKYTCAKCKYRFTYNEETKTPSSCPYCGRAVDRRF
ncbi:MAG TPA: hypothetical protein VK158_06520 [Acidobacteriota bacterium]|nr:hypothetical protein [Acidobacteriota bacterium]